MNEKDSFKIEAALYYGFEYIDDDCTILKCTEEQLLAFIQAIETAKTIGKWP